MTKSKLRLIKERCKENHPCVVVAKCPYQAISQIGYYCPDVDETKCVNCGLCPPYCPYQVFVMEQESDKKC